MDNDILKSNYKVLGITLKRLRCEEDFVRDIAGSTPHIWNNIKEFGKEGKRAFIRKEAINKIHECTGLRYDVLNGKQYLRVKNKDLKLPQYFNNVNSEQQVKNDIIWLIENFDSESGRESYTKEFVSFINYIKHSFKTVPGKTSQKAIEVKMECMSTIDKLHIDLIEVLSIKELEGLEKVLNNKINTIQAFLVIKKEKIRKKK